MKRLTFSLSTPKNEELKTLSFQISDESAQVFALLQAVTGVYPDSFEDIHGTVHTFAGLSLEHFDTDEHQIFDVKITKD
jgi:hypothetical protein